VFHVHHSAKNKGYRARRLLMMLLALALVASVAEAGTIQLGYLYIQGGPGLDNNWVQSWVQESFSQFKIGILDGNNDTHFAQ